MKNKYIILLFLICNVFFAIALIHKQNYTMAILYTSQQLQEQKELLQQRKKELLFELSKQTKLSQVKQFAEQDLGMKAIGFSEVKKISQKG